MAELLIFSFKSQVVKNVEDLLSQSEVRVKLIRKEHTVENT